MSTDDAPVTRPDLDALIRDLSYIVRDRSYVLNAKEIAQIETAAAALAAERARADQAWRAAIERAQDELVRQDSFSDRTLRILDAVRDESAAPTAKQGADQ